MPLPVREPGAVPAPLLRRLHLGSGGPDPRLVLHRCSPSRPCCSTTCLPALRRARARQRRVRAQDVEADRQRGRSDGGDRRVWRRRAALVLPHRAAALGRATASRSTPSASPSASSCTTLWNTYSFWVLYANAEDLKPEDFPDAGHASPALATAEASGIWVRRHFRESPPRRPVSRALSPAAGAVGDGLDRWVLSRLQGTISTVREQMNAYDCTPAGREIAELRRGAVELVRATVEAMVSCHRPTVPPSPRCASCLLEDSEAPGSLHPLPGRRDLPEPDVGRGTPARVRLGAPRRLSAAGRGSRRCRAGGADGGGAQGGGAGPRSPLPREGEGAPAAAQGRDRGPGGGASGDRGDGRPGACRAQREGTAVRLRGGRARALRGEAELSLPSGPASAS